MKIKENILRFCNGEIVVEVGMIDSSMGIHLLKELAYRLELHYSTIDSVGDYHVVNNWIKPCDNIQDREVHSIFKIPSKIFERN